MRMLRPRELARAQGFDDSYVIDRTIDGTDVSRADQVKLIGNSVPPDFAHAIVKANVVDMGVLDDVREAVAS
jgi:DNA (cytosine-5)-methyltransferase 1